MSLCELSRRLNKSKVVINMLSPGTIDTSMSNVISIYLRIPVSVVKAVCARLVEKGAWLILNAIVVMGPDS